MLRSALVLFSMVVVLLVTGVLHAQQNANRGDATKGKILAKRCICHKKGFDSMERAEFVTAMVTFKEGKRGPKSMVSVARDLSEDNVADLAAYFTTK